MCFGNLRCYLGWVGELSTEREKVCGGVMCEVWEDVCTEVSSERSVHARLFIKRVG